MSDEQLIPNAVGRLDDVVAALRAGDVVKASNLLIQRSKDVVAKRDEYAKNWRNADEELQCLAGFVTNLGADRDFAERVRVACGGGERPVINVYDAETICNMTPPEELDELEPGL